MKYNIAFICSFSSLLLSIIQIQTTSPIYTYKPMKERTMNFGDDVCYYEDISNDSHFAYVKPCQEGKKCVGLSISDYNIGVCKEYDDEVYDNRDETCQTKDYIRGTDCTGYSCNINGKCSNTICTQNQVYDVRNNKCVEDPLYCYKYDIDANTGLKDSTAKEYFYPFGHKQCVEIEPVLTKSEYYHYQIQTVKSNYVANIDDGKYIDDQYPNYSYYYSSFCKSGFALYFYGNGELKNPNTDHPSNEMMFLRCVTLLGKDKNDIIKYKIDGVDNDPKYYDFTKLVSPYKETLRSIIEDEYLMLKNNLFSNYKKRLDSLSDCRETNCEDDNELNKWSYFKNNPEEYLLYEKEPQVMEFLIQTRYKYKAEHASPNGSNNLSNIKYLSLFLLLLLF